MTDQELIDYYADLLIVQYNSKPKAYATIQALASLAICNQLPLAVQDAFSLEESEGVQLNVVGKYIGVSRTAIGPNGPISLDDDQYRKLIKMVLIKNKNESSLAAIQELFDAFLPDQVRIVDNQNMSLQYIIREDIGDTDFQYVLVNGGYLPVPMGVGLTVTFVPDFDITYFGFRDYDFPAAGLAPFNNYNFYVETYPWITYEV